MSNKLGDLRDTFAKATMSKVLRHVTSPHALATIRRIQDNAAEKRRVETEFFTENYDYLYQNELATRIDQAGRKEDPTLRPAWASHNRFSKDTLSRLAHHAIKAAHQKRLTQIDQSERSAILKITEVQRTLKALKSRKEFASSLQKKRVRTRTRN